MHRFHFQRDALRDGVVELDKKESRHALSVLRLKSGDVVELIDGEGGRFDGVVIGGLEGRLRVQVRETRAAEEQTVSVTLAVSVIKPERMELLIEKACELGVSRIQPMFTERSVVRLSAERWNAKRERWAKIALASCKQCGQARIPTIEAVQDFSRIVSSFKEYDAVLIPALSVPAKSLKAALAQAGPVSKVLALIGPEGDFSQKEAETAIAAGAKPVNLGSLVLRSETAALYVLSVLQFHCT